MLKGELLRSHAHGELGAMQADDDVWDTEAAAPLLARARAGDELEAVRG